MYVTPGPGTARCICNEHWEGDGRVCTPISLCASADCGPNSICLDIAPGEVCVALQPTVMFCFVTLCVNIA